MGQVWGFVVNTDSDKKFKKGDLLKAAGFNAPARNAARGNVLEGGFGIRWTQAFIFNQRNKEKYMVATKKYLTNIHLIGDEKKEPAIANILGDREIDSVENAYEALE